MNHQPVTTIPAIPITRTRLALALAALAIFMLGVLAGCAKFTEPFRDAPRAGPTNSAPAQVIEMPDGFNNLATKCDHGYRIWVSYHQDGNYGFMAVASDPACRTQ
jgi:hypothetical protein